MSEHRNHCPQCGAPLTSDAPQGLCPRCLLIGATFNTDAEVGPHGTKIVPPPPGIEAVRAAFPQLEVIELIGRGGMGVVYKARQKTLDRLVALKLLAPERVTDAHFAERFTREAQALARLNHPNIVTIHDFGVATAPQLAGARTSTPFYFLLMEFVDGVNLRQAMKAGRFTPEQALAIVPPVCEALQFAHERGIVHRDIKPENLLLDKTGRVKIADFGIAKILADNPSVVARPSDTLSPTGGEGRSEDNSATVHTAAGTPQYMAPEQRQQHGTDHRADIYSLGVVLYELLTGELPGAKLQPPSRRVQIDVRLDEIVLRALETKPELRYQTAGEFRTQVETLAPSTAAAPANAQENPLGNLLLRLAIPAMAFAMALFHPGNPLAWLALGIFAAATALLLPYLPWCVKGRWQRGGQLSAPGPWKRGTRFGLLALMLATLGARVWMGNQNPSLPIQSSVSSDHRAFVLPIQLNGGQIIVLFGLLAGIAIFLRLRSRDGAQKATPENAAPLQAGAPRRLWFAPATPAAATRHLSLKPWERSWLAWPEGKRAFLQGMLFLLALTLTLCFGWIHREVVPAPPNLVPGAFQHEVRIHVGAGRPWLTEFEKLTERGRQSGSEFHRATPSFFCGLTALAVWILLIRLVRVTQGKDIIRLRTLVDAKGHSRVLWPNVIAAWLGVVAWVSLTILLLIAAMISFVGGGPPVIPSLLVSIIPASIVVFMGLRLPPTAKGIVAPPVNSGREQIRPAPVSLTPPLKSARGKFTTPEYLATPLGGFLKHQGEGELSLHANHLVFAAGGQRTAIPFSAIKQIGAARGPRWTSPAGHQYLWLAYEDGGQQRQLLFMAGTGLFRFAGETADTAAEWIEAIRETARAGGYPPIPGLPVTPLVVPASPWISLAVVLPLLVIALLAPLAATRELRLSPIEILLVAIGPLFLIGGLGVALSHFMRLRLPPAAKGVVAPPGSSGREQPPSEQSAIRNPQSAMDQSLLTSAPTGRLWRGPAVVLALLYGALLILLFTTVPDLPQRMAIHFNADGQADNWASRTTHALFIAGMPLLITALFSGLAALTLKFPKKLVNIPRRDYWLAPERAQFTTALMLRWMLWLACLMTIYFGALHWIVLLANQTQPAKISMSEMLPLVIGFLIGCMIWTTSLAMRFAEAERYEQSLKDRFNRARPFSVRRQIISAALTLIFIFVTRTWLASTYTIRTDALTPELPTGSLVLAWKLNRNYAPGDLIVYRHSKGHASVGRVTGSEPDAVLVNRNDQPGFRVERAKIEGKVISVLWRSAARDPNWVSVSLAKSIPDASTTSASNASGGVIMNWEVQASQPGLVSLLREGGQSTASLKRDPKTELHQIAVRVELTQAGTDRVLLVTTLGGSMAREELPGDLRELSAELLRSKNQSATTVRGTEIELCRFQGKPIKVLVPVLAVADPSAAPNTVQVFGQSKSYESTVTLSWEVSASQPGLAGFSRRSPIMVLKQDSKGNRHRVSASLELTRLDGDRVQFVRRIGQNDLREEIDGNFRELADELLRTANFRINATSGTPIELCQFQGKPFTVQVYGQTSTVTTSSPAKMVSWRLLIFLTIGLLVVAGVIVLLVVLWRKGGTAGKVVALVIAVPLLLLAMVVAVLLGSRGSGPGFTAAQLAKSEQVVLDPNNPGPVASHPPGQVQQPQNGFRLQQPAAVPKSGAAPDPAAAIEMKVALQQLEKTLTSLADTEAEIASLQLSLGAAHPSVEALRSKMIVLEKEAARLRSDIEAKQTRPAASSDPVLTIETAPPKSKPEAAKSADEGLWIASVTNQLGRLCLYGVLAVAFYVARRRTSLLGFRLLFVFAVGELALMIIGFFMASWLAINFGVQASNYFAYARAALDFALYAVAFAGVISLLVSWRRSPN